jgi:hypothetical protein
MDGFLWGLRGTGRGAFLGGGVTRDSGDAEVCSARPRPMDRLEGMYQDTPPHREEYHVSERLCTTDFSL